MLSKEKFVEIMEEFIDNKKAADRWIDKVEDCLGGAWEAILNYNFEINFINLLSLVMDDVEEWIEYFVYERNCEWFDCEIDGEERAIDNLEKLYDLIVEKEN